VQLVVLAVTQAVAGLRWALGLALLHNLASTLLHHPLASPVSWWLVGAGYLVFLGAHAVWTAIRPRGRMRPDSGRARSVDRATALRHGLFSNLGNPKMAIFFSSLLPQFVPAGPAALGSMLGLGLLFVSMTLGWLCLYATVVARFGDLLRRPRIRRAFDAVRAEAASQGVAVVDSEIVGLVPAAALAEVDLEALKLAGFSTDQILEHRL